nr:unnamed protein product [Timema californicum]
MRNTGELNKDRKALIQQGLLNRRTMLSSSKVINPGPYESLKRTARCLYPPLPSRNYVAVPSPTKRVSSVSPTLRFRRINNREEKDYFACSTCRDRKDCTFFLWADEDVTEDKSKFWDLERERILPKINHSELIEKLERIRQKKSRKRAYCHTCSVLLNSAELSAHSAHTLTLKVSDFQLTHPTELLKPFESSKKEAQYLFSKQSTTTIVTALCNLGAKHVVCLGTPRIHECILTDYEGQLTSLLLDIDHRYHNFYNKDQFCWYNSFNNYFFGGESSAAVLSQFLQKGDGEGVVLVTDPPFGGRVEPLAYTLKKITQLHRKLNPEAICDLPVLWMFPYFMEPHILANCPGYNMLDYKVDYDNHSLFASGPKARKHGSPVRIFTNLQPKLFKLSTEEGYRYCDVCERWVSEENKHCDKCNECTSKDGRTYVHCDMCSRCVKPSWRHCATCARCCLPSHVCGEFMPSSKCFICGMKGHKKKECPLHEQTFQVFEYTRRGKRKHNTIADLHSNKKVKTTQGPAKHKQKKKWSVKKMAASQIPQDNVKSQSKHEDSKPPTKPQPNKTFKFKKKKVPKAMKKKINV